MVNIPDPATCRKSELYAFWCKAAVLFVPASQAVKMGQEAFVLATYGTGSWAQKDSVDG